MKSENHNQNKPWRWKKNAFSSKNTSTSGILTKWTRQKKGLEANLFEIWILELYIIRVREVADSEAEEKERNSSVLRLWFWTQMMHML